MKKLFRRINAMTPQKRKRVWSSVAIILLVVVFGLIFGFVAFKNHMIAQYMSHFSPPPASVSVTKAKAQTWHPYIASVGTLQAVQGGIGVCAPAGD